MNIIYYLRDWIVYAELWNATLDLLAITILIFFLLSLLLAGYTILLRFIHIKQKRRWEALESRWEQSLLEILSGGAPVDNLHHLVHKNEQLYFVDFLQRFVRLLKGKDIDTLKSLARPYLEGIQRRLKSKDAERRARAVQTLGILGLEIYANDIIKALDDPSPLVS